ncbi:hypothetical protein P691DRAFT_812044 [Macrolepiota fuliginosa MF-IS2]|uniref:Uncharacterized protein n=1 Tax=Macrolepiota fuliginosa MF-IS2 TaxID=1400762 RepID=A0A9P6BXS8_9AGAR|nr:hypothetical protein P691DRAFT_812044 [Macrolepiota fuliginosa MF-IS2]
MSTSLSGWHSRATPYTHPFIPERSAISLVILRNAPAEPEGFTLALFNSPAKIAVDAGGGALVLQDADFDGLIALAEQTKNLPQTGRFRNTWVVAQPITSRPIDRILVPVQSGEGSGYQQDFKETSVQGYDGVTTRLKQSVGDIQDLPSVLQDLIGLVLEAREGGQVNKDDALISQVKSILGDVF